MCLSVSVNVLQPSTFNYCTVKLHTPHAIDKDELANEILQRNLLSFVLLPLKERVLQNGRKPTWHSQSKSTAVIDVCWFPGNLTTFNNDGRTYGYLVQ